MKLLTYKIYLDGSTSGTNFVPIMEYNGGIDYNNLGIDKDDLFIYYNNSSTSGTSSGTSGIGWDEDKYVDITSLENWYKFGDKTKLDYKAVREEIKKLAAEKTNNYSDWDNLSSENKERVARFMACPVSKVIEIFGTGDKYDEVVNKWVENSKEARLKRWEKAKLFTFKSLGESSAKKVLKDVENDNLKTLYFEGVEGLDVDNINGIFDYIDSKEGSIYENSGLRNFNTTPINGLTLDEVCDRILEIFIKGI